MAASKASFRGLMTRLSPGRCFVDQSSRRESFTVMVFLFQGVSAHSFLSVLRVASHAKSAHLAASLTVADWVYKVLPGATCKKLHVNRKDKIDTPESKLLSCSGLCVAADFINAEHTLTCPEINISQSKKNNGCLAGIGVCSSRINKKWLLLDLNLVRNVLCKLAKP